MADDAMVSNTATLERPSDNGQGERASNERIQGGTDGQHSANGQAAQGNDDNIRNLQSTYDKKLAAKDRELSDLRRQQQQAQQQFAQLQQRLNQMEESAAPDDYARMELRLKRAEEQAAQYAQAYQQSVQAQEAERARQNALREVAEEFGVTPKDLEEATDYMSAVKLAVKVSRDKETRKQQDDDDKRERNMPDLGSGAPRTTDSEWDRAYAEARQNRDSVAMARLLRERGRPK